MRTHARTHTHTHKKNTGTHTQIHIYLQTDRQRRAHARSNDLFFFYPQNVTLYRSSKSVSLSPTPHPKQTKMEASSPCIIASSVTQQEKQQRHHYQVTHPNRLVSAGDNGPSNHRTRTNTKIIMALFYCPPFIMETPSYNDTGSKRQCLRILLHVSLPSRAVR